jgi:hypothetical protein
MDTNAQLVAQLAVDVAIVVTCLVLLGPIGLVPAVIIIGALHGGR